MMAVETPLARWRERSARGAGFLLAWDDMEASDGGGSTTRVVTEAGSEGTAVLLASDGPNDLWMGGGGHSALLAADSVGARDFLARLDSCLFQIAVIPSGCIPSCTRTTLLTDFSNVSSVEGPALIFELNVLLLGPSHCSVFSVVLLLFRDSDR
jgi:hypothetical protein